MNHPFFRTYHCVTLLKVIYAESNDLGQSSEGQHIFRHNHKKQLQHNKTHHWHEGRNGTEI